MQFVYIEYLRAVSFTVGLIDEEQVQKVTNPLNTFISREDPPSLCALRVQIIRVTSSHPNVHTSTPLSNGEIGSQVETVPRAAPLRRKVISLMHSRVRQPRYLGLRRYAYQMVTFESEATTSDTMSRASASSL